MVFIQNTHVFNCRSEKHSIFSKNVKENRIVYLGVLGSILLEIIVMRSKFLSSILKTGLVPVEHMIILMLLAFTVIIVMEIYKKIRYNKD